MDILEYGIKNQDSISWLKRLSAEGVLSLAKVQADLYEAHLERKQIRVTEREDETKAMLERIYARIEHQTAQARKTAGKAPGEN